ncbi:glycoside hydrolase family 2 TIM barrel-domain containing protein [Niabella hirudinis]|uniref:glycoside hydrolase family 2 TIM barrel-domain containing protein n=1 Tax=Niabella hirudinis TaxID=1285929 RepID=UPI003EC13725
MKKIFLLFVALLYILCTAAQQAISLKGKWRVGLDSTITEPPPATGGGSFFKYTIQLPGSLDEAGLGNRVTNLRLDVLNRKVAYTGPAWYHRTITIPVSWKQKTTVLFIERALWKVNVWVDGKKTQDFGERLLTPNRIKLGVLSPGQHTLVVCVDNRPLYNIGIWSHAYSDMMQTIWNGMIGRLELQAQDKTSISNIKVYPSAAEKKITVSLTKHGSSSVAVAYTLMEKKSKKILAHGKKTGTDFEIQLLSPRLWDEFDPFLYTLIIKNGAQVIAQDIGFRNITTANGQFIINGRPVLMRGTHDGGIFPLTGYPSCDVKDWQRIFSICKSYGLNHVRFHSWTPPRAAFEAADEAGIYLQCELPFFGNEAPPMGADTARDHYLKRELKSVLDAYGNHPSFCMVAMGNELRGNYKVLDDLVQQGKTYDPRHLYTRVSNPEAGGKFEAGPYDDFLVLHAYRKDGRRYMRRGEEIFDFEKPATLSDYRAPAKVPVISHEVGQWFIYPGYNEIKKYAGVLTVPHYQQFRTLMEKNGMKGMDAYFQQASGRFVTELYKEEIERQLRTPGYGGFQLLDLHDYPGQGVALDGILDAFWDSKGLVKPTAFRRFCSEAVPLLRMKKRVWQTAETFNASAEIAYYAKNKTLKLFPQWEVTDSAGRILYNGSLPATTVTSGSLQQLGDVSFPLDKITTAQKLTITVLAKGTPYQNSWNIWVYPAIKELYTDILIADTLDAATSAALQAGKKILLLTGALQKARPLRFPTPFWNTQLFPDQPSGCGILCNPAHPAFKDFPTDFYSNWQWWELLHARTASYSRPPASAKRSVVLNKLPQNYKPLVQVIDDPWHGNKLGVVFELKIGSGKLLVCTLDISSNLSERIVARQLRYSLLNYMSSTAFSPVQELTAEEVRGLLY